MERKINMLIRVEEIEADIFDLEISLENSSGNWELFKRYRYYDSGKLIGKINELIEKDRDDFFDETIDGYMIIDDDEGVQYVLNEIIIEEQFCENEIIEKLNELEEAMEWID